MGCKNKIFKLIIVIKIKFHWHNLGLLF